MNIFIRCDSVVLCIVEKRQMKKGVNRVVFQEKCRQTDKKEIACAGIFFGRGSVRRGFSFSPT